MGRVTYPDGRPAPDAAITGVIASGPWSREIGTQSDANGNFSLRGVPSGLSYTICPSHQSEGFLNVHLLPFGLPWGGKCATILVRSGEQISNLELQLAPKAAALAGSVLNARTGQPLRAIRVIVYRPLRRANQGWIPISPKLATSLNANAVWTPSREQYTDEGGDFSFNELPPGQYYLKVTAKGYHDWFSDNRQSEASTRPVMLKSGMTARLKIILRPSDR